MKLKHTILIAGFFSGLICPAFGNFLAVDFREGRIGNAPDAPGTAADVLAAFQTADPALSGATVADVVINVGDAPINEGTSGNNGTTWNDLATPNDFGDFTVSTLGDASGFRAGTASWNDLAPISETYCFEGSGTAVNTLIVSGIGSVAGEIITLTCWGVGDNTSQDARFTARYSDAEAQTAETLYNGPGEARNSSVGSIPWVQFQFTSDGTDTIEFDWQQSDNGGTGAFNGFSISVSTATFGDVNTAALSAPGETTLLVGSADVQLTATANFTVAGDRTVTGLGSSVVTYASTDTSVASVSDSGVVTFGAPGVANISATVFGDNNQVTTNTVTFNVEAPTSFTLSLPDPTFLLSFGPAIDLNVTADSLSLTGVALEGRTGFSYISSDADVIEVDDAGLLTPTFPGTEVITAELLIPGQAAFTASVAITVEDATNIVATVPTNTLFIGGAGVTISLAVTTPNINTPIVINSIPGVGFNSDGGSDLQVGLEDGSVFPGNDDTNLGDSIITCDWLLSDDSLLSTSVTMTLAAIPLKPITLLHHYDFDGAAGSALDGTIIADSVGSADGVVVDDGATFTGTGLVLPGGAQNPGEGEAAGAYIDLPNGLVSSLPAAITIESLVTVSSNGFWMRIFDFGNAVDGEDSPGFQTNHLMFTPRGGGNRGIYSENSLNRATSGTDTLATNVAITNDEVHHYVLTYDTEVGVRNIYYDGALVGSSPLTFGNSELSAFLDEGGMPNDLNNWLGRSNAGDIRFDGVFEDFRIYSGTMTAEEVLASFNAAIGVPDLTLAVTSLVGGNLSVEVGGLANDVVYHFERYNLTTSEFETLPNTEFLAEGATSNQVIDITGLGATELIRLLEGPEPGE